ncbi:iron-sulfur cluster assembly protein [Catenulispora sp. GP43]
MTRLDLHLMFRTQGPGNRLEYPSDDKHREEVLLTLTDRAAEAVRNLTTQSDLPDESAGLRIVSHGAAQNSGQGQLSLSLSQGPHSGDAVVETGPARVFLEAEAAQALNDQQLDATVADDGGVRFLLAPQQ